MANPSDLLLLERWRDHRDADAFGEIVARHAAMVHGTCQRVLHNDADAEDVAQECFFRLAQERVRVRFSLGGFLHRLALGLSKNRLTSETRRREREKRRVTRREVGADPRWEDAEEHVDGAIDRLSAEVREIVVAHYLERETLESIAERLGGNCRNCS